MSYGNHNSSESGRMGLIDPAEGTPCHEAELLISRRLDGELSEDDIERLDAHLADCAHCSATLAEWQGHSHQLNTELDALWSASAHQKPIRRNETRIRKLSKPPQKKIKACMWIPISMIASQFAAFVLLGLYFLLWPQSAEAPYGVSRPDPQTPRHNHQAIPDAEDVQRNIQRNALLPISGPIIAAPKPCVPPELHECPEWPKTQPWAMEVNESVVLASFDREPLNLVVADNIWSVYQTSAAEGVLSGRLTLLTDAKSGKAFVEITAVNGSKQDIAAEDVQTLDCALRSIVSRFLERATKAEALRRSAR